MFTTGRLIFAALFVVVFTIIIVVSYKKDSKLHQKNYQGVKWVGIFFLIFLILLFAIKYFLKN